jgi:hypothetical protein
MADLTESNLQRVDAILHGGGLEVRHRSTSVVQEHLGYGSRDSEYGDGGKDAIGLRHRKGTTLTRRQGLHNSWDVDGGRSQTAQRSGAHRL